MKKLSVLTAMAVIGWAGQALAQTSSQILTATANINAVVTLNLVDGVFECGEVAAGDTACNTAADRSAEYEVIANSDWTLTLVDDGGANNPDEVTLTGGVNNDDDFVLALTLDAYNGTSTGSQTIMVTETGAAGISGLDNSDDYGTYEGTATLTLTGT